MIQRDCKHLYGFSGQYMTSCGSCTGMVLLRRTGLHRPSPRPRAPPTTPASATAARGTIAQVCINAHFKIAMMYSPIKGADAFQKLEFYAPVQSGACEDHLLFVRGEPRCLDGRRGCPSKGHPPQSCRAHAQHPDRKFLTTGVFLTTDPVPRGPERFRANSVPVPYRPRTAPPGH